MTSIDPGNVVYATRDVFRPHVSKNIEYFADRTIFATIARIYLKKLECGPMPKVMAARPNIGGALCSTPQSLADAHYKMSCSNAAKK